MIWLAYKVALIESERVASLLSSGPDVVELDVVVVVVVVVVAVGVLVAGGAPGIKAG